MNHPHEHGRGYTRFPHWIADEYLANDNLQPSERLKPSDWAVLHVIVRQTVGFNRTSHNLSTSFLAKATNQTEQPVRNALKKLLALGLIRKLGTSNDGTVYEVHPDIWRYSGRGEPPQAKQGGKKGLPPSKRKGGKIPYPNKENYKEIDAEASASDSLTAVPEDKGPVEEAVAPVSIPYSASPCERRDWGLKAASQQEREVHIALAEAGKSGLVPSFAAISERKEKELDATRLSGPRRAQLQIVMHLWEKLFGPLSVPQARILTSLASAFGGVNNCGYERLTAEMCDIAGMRLADRQGRVVQILQDRAAEQGKQSEPQARPVGFPQTDSRPWNADCPF